MGRIKDSLQDVQRTGADVTVNYTESPQTKERQGLMGRKVFLRAILARHD
jgi:hypothetical protein